MGFYRGGSKFGHFHYYGLLAFTTAFTTQPPTLSGTRNEYQPKYGAALRLGVKVWFIPLVDKP